MIAIMFASHVERLVRLSDRDISLDDGTCLFRAGDVVRFLFVVRQGNVHMLRRQAAGAALTLQRVRPGGLVAEASLFAQRYHCEAHVAGQTVLARVPKTKALELQVAEPGWMREFAAHLAGEVQRARTRAELLSLKRVSDRVDAWCGIYPNEIPDRGGWVAWASELGVTPEALYRELSRRRA